MKRILYAGDSPAGGPANYLLAILGTLPVSVTHIPPGVKLELKTLEKKEFDAFILSDYSRADLSHQAEKEIANSVRLLRAGLLMIGGWGSFSGPFGKWNGSLVERLLPVSCLTGDDRRNVCTGLLIEPVKRAFLIKDFSFENAPVICGLNEVRLKPRSKVVLRARVLTNRKGKPLAGRKSYPLLVTSETEGFRTAALMTDLAPHWCGGWVDWGKKRVTLPVKRGITVEVGAEYVRFAALLLRWIARIDA